MDRTGTCVDPELDLVRGNSTTDQNVSQLSLPSIINNVCDGARKLLEFIPSMKNAVNEIEKAEMRVKNALTGITADSDLDVVCKLTNLQKEFRAFIRVGKDFLEYCLSMAKYVRNERHIAEIKEELRQEIVVKLKVYIDKLSCEYLTDCDESYKCFETRHREMDHKFSSAKGDFSNQLQEVKKETSDAKGKQEKAVVERETNIAIPKALALLSSASATVGVFGMSSPEVAATQTLVSFFSSFLAGTNEGPAILDIKQRERILKEAERKKKILEDALNRLSKLYVSISNAVSSIEDMKHYSDLASKVIETRLKKYANTSTSFEIHDVSNKLDSLQRAAGEIEKAIGEDGINPISSDPGELVSTNQPHQTTDTGEATMQDMMSTLNLSSQPNGNFSNPSQDGEITPPLGHAEQELGDPARGQLVARQ